MGIEFNPDSRLNPLTNPDNRGRTPGAQQFKIGEDLKKYSKSASSETDKNDRDYLDGLKKINDEFYRGLMKAAGLKSTGTQMPMDVVEAKYKGMSPEEAAKKAERDAKAEQKDAKTRQKELEEKRKTGKLSFEESIEYAQVVAKQKPEYVKQQKQQALYVTAKASNGMTMKEIDEAIGVIYASVLCDPLANKFDVIAEKYPEKLAVLERLNGYKAELIKKYPILDQNFTSVDGFKRAADGMTIIMD